MSKISVTLGLTLKVNSGGGFNFFRPEITISDIDVDADTEPQIERSLAAIREAWSHIETEMGTIVDGSEIAEKPSALTEINKRMAEFEADLHKLKTTGATSGEFSVDLEKGDDSW